MRVVLYVFYELIVIYSWVIFVYVLMSWLPHSSGILKTVYDILGKVCDPFLSIFQKVLKPIRYAGGAVDISPILAFFALQLLSVFVRMMM